MEDNKKSSKALEMQPPGESQTPPPSPIIKIIIVASIAAGIQFGWALQLSLLTPYVQLLGIPHKWAPLIWLCGPISGMLVQPLVGYYSDRSTSRFGRRRPFIAAGAGLVAVAVILIGFAADIGHMSGDNLKAKAKPRAIAVFVVGFWILDVANNMLQGPCRAFLADLAAGDQQRTRTANSFFSFFMAVGNVLGFAAGRDTHCNSETRAVGPTATVNVSAFSHLHNAFPFTSTTACDVYCANLKSCFILSILLLLTLTIIALCTVSEPPLTKPELDTTQNPNSTSEPFFKEIFAALKDLPRPMWILLLVTCLNWIAWFPFLLFDTDWMGREVYGGVAGEAGPRGDAYGLGVRAGALGLMLNSVVLGAVSLAVEPLARVLGGVKRLWGGVNFLLAVCLAMTVPVTKAAQAYRHHYAALNGGAIPLKPDAGAKGGALAIFSVLGVPLAITYSIPFAMASIFSSSSGAGQGLSLGVLNLAIVIPQMFVSLLSGHFDDLFGGGNLPAFVVGAVSAAASAVMALVLLPSPPPDAAKIARTVGGFH